MDYKKYHPTYQEFKNKIDDPDDQGNSWQGMYNLMRCVIPRC
jgi:hypothetical protein